LPIDYFTKSEILESINRIDELIGTDVFLPKNIKNPFVMSAFIEVLICLRDLMYKTEKYSERIHFDDDIVKTKDVQDISDVIKYVRDALCHLDSDKHYSEQGCKASYNIMYKKGCLLKSGNFEQVSDHDDDVCFFFGTQRIYLKRHILRAFNEAKAKLLPLIS
jgi:hypothetical protein